MEGLRMSIKELLAHIAANFTFEDILYILGKDPEWLLWKIKDELIENREEFFIGDEYYSGLSDD